MIGECLQLFPTPVGRLVFREPTPVEWKILNYELNSLVPNQGNYTTHEMYILDHPNLVQLKADLTQMINEYFDEVYKPKEPIRLYITASWCNVTKSGEYHHLHNHKNSLISGTYYLQVGQDDGIVFTKSTENSLCLTTYPRETNIFNNYTYKVDVNNSDLVLFPSSLMHEVQPKSNPGSRISLSFNTFATGLFGADPATHLQLK